MGKHAKTNDKKNSNLGEDDSSNNLNPKKKKKKHTGLKIFLLIVLLLIIAVCVILKNSELRNKFLANSLRLALGHNEETVKNLDKLQVLILGESTGMSDTIIVASYDPKTQKAALMSIPRDTFTGESKKNAKYYHKLNALYNHGETPEKTLEAVNSITGLNIKYYIIVDTEALVKLVDKIGGLEFDVPIDMNYDDASQDLYIHLTAGYQKLNGSQVEQLVRFRHNNNGTTYPYSYANGVEDHGRSKTQRNVLIAIAKQTLQFKNITEISSIIDIFKEYVSTNLNLDIIKDYIPYALNLDMDSIKVGRIPGKDDVVNGIWFYFHDEEGTKELVDELFNDVTESEDNITDTNSTITDTNTSF